MEIEKEIDKRKELQSLILNFIDDDEEDDENFQSLAKFINDNNISKTKIDLQDLLHLLAKIADNYHRGIDFFSKIIKIINYLLPDVRSFYKDQGIYQIFSQNKILILNLIQNNSIILDEQLLNRFRVNLFIYQTKKRLLSPYNCLYLYLHYKSVNNTQNLKQIEQLINSNINMDIEQFIQLCQKGENEHHICQLIRQDSVNEFISYINENNYDPDSKIPFSAFETNNFLQRDNIRLIEYASFYSSIQIVKYLIKNEVKIDSTLLEFAVHGRNAEIIHMIEDHLGENLLNDRNITKNSFGFGIFNNNNNIDKMKKKMKGPIGALIESIKCFHNEIANYFEQNGCYTNDEDELQKLIIASGFDNYNYEFIPNNFDLLFPFSRYQNSSFRFSTFEDAFKIFYTLTEMTVPPSVTKIPDSCFEKLTNLNKIIISSSVTEIGVGSFIGCSSLKDVSLSSSLKSIGDKAFMGCTSLVKVLFDDEKSSLESIGKNSFANCSSLKQILIPSSLKILDDNAFSKCTSLINVSFQKNSSLQSIGKSTFSNCTSLSQILIPSSLMLIDEKAFMNCKSLSNVSFKDPCSLTSIGKSAFAFCISLTSFILPTSVTSIDDHVFENCSSLKQISIHSSVTSIGDCVFSDCTSLTNISIPDSVKSIGRCSFDNCSLLVEASIPSSLTFIGDYLFENCSSLNKISIPSSVTSIGEYSFSKCTSLEQVLIPSSVTLIGKGSFKKCSSLVQVSIPSSVTLIGNYAFEDCSSLKQIEIPSSVTSIGDYSFRKCVSLEKVIISSSETKIGYFSFSGCKSLPKSAIPIDFNNDQGDKDEIHKYLQNRKYLYNCILNYFESSDEISDHLLELIHKIEEDEYDLIELLNLLSNLSIEASSTSIIKKTVKILDICKESIKQKICNNKLCSIFKKNKRILLFLKDNSLLELDNKTLNVIMSANNDYYQDNTLFYLSSPETNNSKKDENQDEIELKKAGENHNKICIIIRNDSLDEFISQLEDIKKEKKNEIFKINNLITPNSQYETNSLLNNVKYIQYAAFYGATKIFNYLFKKEFSDDDNDNDTFSMNINNNEKERSKQFLWQFAIHGRQQEILHILDKNGIKPSNENNTDQNNDHAYYMINEILSQELNVQNCFEIAIQCHENEIARDLMNNSKIETNYLNAIKNFNFEFIEDFYKIFEEKISYLLFCACFYDYPKLAQLLIKNKNIDLDAFSNEHTIDTKNYFGYQYNQENKSDKFNIINAAIKSDNEIIKYLIKTQKNIEFEGSLLVEIIQKNNRELLKIMLSQPNLNVNEISYTKFYFRDESLDHFTPLFLAILQRDIEIINLLLNHPNIEVNKSLKPNTSRTTYRTALHIAIEMEYVPAVKLLLERPDIDVNAIANIDEDSFNFHEWSNASHFDFYYTPLHEAVELKNIEIIKLLLAHPKIDVNIMEVYDNYESKYKGVFDRVRQSVLCRAIQMQNLEIVQLLLQHPGIDVNKKAVFHQNDTDGSYNNNNNNHDGDDNVEEEEKEDVDELDEEKEDVDELDEEKEDVDDEEQKQSVFSFNKLMYRDDEESTIIVRRTPLDFAYAGKSKEITQLLLSRDDIKVTKAKRKDVLIHNFTKDIAENSRSLT